MASWPVVSVITPSYNQGQFLAETIESVISQEGEFFLDYYIVDGGSTDNSLPVIRRYEKLIMANEWDVKCRGLNYRWLSEKDGGQTDALIKGFKRTEGEILAWLNSDDVYLPGALQSAVAFFQNNVSTALLYGDANYCDVDGKVVGRYPTGVFDFAKLAWFNYICQPSTFFKRKAFAEVGGLNPNLHFAMDYDLFVRLGKLFPVGYLPQTFSKYRLHETSKTMCNEDLFKNHEEVLSLALKYYDWAPSNRIYGSCNYFCLLHLPRALAKVQLLIVGATIFCTLIRSLRLNRGLCRADLKLLSRNNFRKLFKDRLGILKG